MQKLDMNTVAQGMKSNLIFFSEEWEFDFSIKPSKK